jgi:hypothetical protein
MNARTTLTRATLRAMADARGYVCKRGGKRPTLRICEDGTIYRADVELHLTKRMTLRQAAQALHIN